MKYPWLQHYPETISATINTERFTCLSDMLTQTVIKYRKNIAFSNMGTNLTYNELDEKSRAFAAYLMTDLGLKKGERVAIMMPNILQYPIALFGILRAGLTVVNVNPLYTKHELIQILNDSEAKAIVILNNFAHVLSAAQPELNFLKHVILSEIGDLFPAFKRILFNFVVKYIKRMVKPYYLPSAVEFRWVLCKGKHMPLKAVDIQRDDIAFLQYTGGTTGVSKGTMLTHSNIIANILQMSAWMDAMSTKFQEVDVVITPLPLYHIFSLVVNCMTFVMRGGQNILITNPRDIHGFIKELRKTSFTAISGVNTLYNALMNHPNFTKINFSHLRMAIAGGMALQQAVAERWQSLTKRPLIEGYGLTEASPVVTANPLTIEAYTGTIGYPLPSTEVSIRDEQQQELPANTPGELWVRGPQVMKGYWKNIAETQKILTEDGWLKTGDIAVMSDQGEISIVDRKKDMIIVSGFNVYPNEVEDIIAKHPGVLEVAVVGVPDELSGEKVKAFIVKRDSQLTEKEIIDYCHQFLTRYKVPKAVEFRHELPKSPIGKILRRELRK